MSRMPDSDVPLFQMRTPTPPPPRPITRTFRAIRSFVVGVYWVVLVTGATVLIAGALWVAWFVLSVLSTALGIR